MKDLKNSGVRSTALLTASLLTTISLLPVNTLFAETEASGAVCEALGTNTALDKETIETRIACYGDDVIHLSHLVEQLVDERDELLVTAQDSTSKLDEYQQQLEQRQNSMQRLQERAASLTEQIDQITADRNQIRNQLYGIINEGKDRSVDLEANEKLFESFSESYVTQSIEIEELRKKLAEFESQNTDLTTQSEELASAKSELETENQSLADQITGLEQSVADLTEEKTQLETELADANNQMESMKNQLMENAEISQQQLSEISDLKTALDESEKARLDLEGQISSLNENHLAAITPLNDQITSLGDEISSLKEQQLALQNQSDLEQQQADERSDQMQATLEARDRKIVELSQARLALNSERAELLGKITSLEDEYLKQSLGFQDQAKDLEGEISQLTQDKSALDDELQSQKNVNKELKLSAKQTSTQNAELNDAASALQVKLQTAETSAADLQASLDDLTEQAATDKDNYQKQTLSFRNQAKALRNEISQLSLDKSALDDELQSQKTANEELKLSAEQSSAQNARLEDDASALQVKLQTAETSAADLQANLNDLTEQSAAEKDKLSLNVAELEAQLEKASADQKALTANLMATEKKSMETSDRLESLKSDTETLKSLLAMSRTHGKNADSTLAELRTELNASNSRLAKRQDELDALVAEKARIENSLRATANQTKTQAQAIEQTLRDAGHDDVQVSMGEDNTIAILLGSGQLFNTGSSALTVAGKNVLDDLAETFSKVEDRRIIINGHSDNVPLGPKLAAIFTDNYGLSLARALSTAEYFKTAGSIAADRMAVSGFGDTKPLDPEDTPEARRKNRRVEIQLAPVGDTVASAQ